MVTPRARRSRARGATMMELVCATVLLVAIATGAAWMLPSQLRAIVRSHEESSATRFATSRIERLRGTTPALGTHDVPADGSATADLSGAAATETITIAGEGLARVAVEVTWNAADGGRGRVHVETLLATEPVR